jgi:hypothetical protein
MVVTEIAPSREEMQSLSVSEDAVKGSVPVPVERRERISSIDIVRGFALLGILVLNIGSFAGPEFMHDIPIGIPKPPFVGPHAHLNFAVLLITWILFEGKMRCLFSMLFGAGVILFTARAEKRGSGNQDRRSLHAPQSMAVRLRANPRHVSLVWRHSVHVRTVGVVVSVSISRAEDKNAIRSWSSGFNRIGNYQYADL